MHKQVLNPQRTTWHITFGTKGARLHGGNRPTVDKRHNQRGDKFVEPDKQRESAERGRMKQSPVYLTPEQCRFVQEILPKICQRGGWDYRVASADSDHVHVLCDVDRTVHGQKTRRLIKRWLSQALSQRWPRRTGESWWAEEGSNIAIHDESYLNNAYGYIFNQQMK